MVKGSFNKYVTKKGIILTVTFWQARFLWD